MTSETPVLGLGTMLILLCRFAIKAQYPKSMAIISVKRRKTFEEKMRPENASITIQLICRAKRIANFMIQISESKFEHEVGFCNVHVFLTYK